MAVESVSICTNPTKSAAGCSAAAVSVSVSAAVWAADWMWRRAFFHFLYGLFVFAGRNGGHALEAVFVVGGQDGRSAAINAADGGIR